MDEPGLRLPYDILGSLPAFATSVAELHAWSLVDRYLNKVATPLLYRAIVIDRKRFDKLVRNYRSHVTATGNSYTLKPRFASHPLPTAPALPFHTLSTRPRLASHVQYFLCTVPSLSGAGTPAFLSLLASTLLLLPNLRSLGWRTHVRNTDPLVRVLPHLRRLEELEVERASCPLVSGSFVGMGSEAWGWEYVEGWMDHSTLPSLPSLKHLHLPTPQPQTSPLWLPYLHALTSRSPLVSLSLSLLLPSLDTDPLPTPLILAFASAHAGTLRAFASGPGRMEREAVRGLLGACRRLERVQWAGFEMEWEGDGEDDVRACLACAGPKLVLAIVREVYWRKVDGAWTVVPPEYDALMEFESAVRLPAYEAERGWWDEERCGGAGV